MRKMAQIMVLMSLGSPLMAGDMLGSAQPIPTSQPVHMESVVTGIIGVGIGVVAAWLAWDIANPPAPNNAIVLLGPNDKAKTNLIDMLAWSKKKPVTERGEVQSISFQEQGKGYRVINVPALSEKGMTAGSMLGLGRALGKDSITACVICLTADDSSKAELSKTLRPYLDMCADYAGANVFVSVGDVVSQDGVIDSAKIKEIKRNLGDVANGGVNPVCTPLGYCDTSIRTLRRNLLNKVASLDQFPDASLRVPKTEKMNEEDAASFQKVMQELTDYCATLCSKLMISQELGAGVNKLHDTIKAKIDNSEDWQQMFDEYFLDLEVQPNTPAVVPLIRVFMQEKYAKATALKGKYIALKDALARVKPVKPRTRNKFQEYKQLIWRAMIETNIPH